MLSHSSKPGRGECGRAPDGLGVLGGGLEGLRPARGAEGPPSPPISSDLEMLYWKQLKQRVAAQRKLQHQEVSGHGPRRANWARWDPPPPHGVWSPFWGLRGVLGVFSDRGPCGHHRVRSRSRWRKSWGVTARMGQVCGHLCLPVPPRAVGPLLPPLWHRCPYRDGAGIPQGALRGCPLPADDFLDHEDILAEGPEELGDGDMALGEYWRGWACAPLGASPIKAAGLHPPPPSIPNTPLCPSLGLSPLSRGVTVLCHCW